MPDNVIRYQQDHLDWPFITLKRFEILNQARQEIMKNDWFVFIDADALVTSDITEEEFFDPSKPFFECITRATSLVCNHMVSSLVPLRRTLSAVPLSQRTLMSQPTGKDACGVVKFLMCLN